MTLKDFAIKYNINSQELLDLLIFEKFPIQSIDDEIDNRLLKYLLEYTNKKQSKTLQKNKKYKYSQTNNSYSKNTENKEKKTVKKEFFLYSIPMTIAECVNLTDFSPSHYINFFLKKKKLYSINSLLSTDDIIAFSEEHNIKIIDKEIEKTNESNIIEKKATHGTELRNPIVVVVGHVDHGKTTLLDTIRKKSVAKSEKGGITQHVGAYEVLYNNKAITFLDTPGHAAFTALRTRGITIADIGILVISVEDGIKPQTVESIKILKELKVNVIVALTKIDRIESKNYDNILTQLTTFDLIPEVWGGNIAIIPICAPKEQGISELLETILLISELADLKTNTLINASGYVLETKMEKGKGIVATILLQEGKLKIGDYFYCDDIWGKVTSCFSMQGESIKEMLPGKPYSINGFNDFPEVGGNLIQGDLKTVKEKSDFNKNNKLKEKSNLQQKNSLLNNNKQIYNIIIKADVFSSLQAICQAVETLKDNNTMFYAPIIMHQGLDEITENDINIAINTKSVIYRFNLKKQINKEIVDLIEITKILVISFDIIYHLLEHIEKEIKEEKNKEPVLKKIGDVFVLKLFAIKNIGQIVGFKVTQGIIKVGAIAMVFRNKTLVGKGTIRSLQKEKMSVKELTKGNEGAFSLPAINNFQLEDVIEIYSEL
jgi:translation initiation factor IF-2